MKSLMDTLGIGGAVTDLGMGDQLVEQREQMTEEEKRRKRLGLSPLQPGSPAVQSIFGMTGVGGGRGY